MKFLEKLKKKIRDYDAKHGYSCDCCGKEIFNYPNQRLCSSCEEALLRNHEKTCSKCGRKTLAEGVCLDCKRMIPGFDRGFSPFVYVGESAALINRMKNGKPRLAHYFGERMADIFLNGYEKKSEFSEESENEWLIVPIPLNKERLRFRGYNQAELLAWSVERRLIQQGYRASVDTSVLIKHKDDSQQKHLHYKERFINAAASYSVANRKACKNRTILLIDDILTTGATGGECAKKLLSAGAKEVLFLCATALPEKKQI